MKAEEVHKFHFIGIGGTGMSGVAQICLDNGFEVSGSDLRQSETTARLSTRGAMISFPHDPFNVRDTPVVVISSAIPESNVELSYARSRGLVVKRRAELLGWFMQKFCGIAVAGSHGKTTTTSMVSSILTEAGLDPTVVVGGEASHMGGNARMGRGKYLVAEADESDGSFQLLPAQHAILTNLDNDHLEHYGSLQALQQAFSDYARALPHKPVVCIDDDFLRELSKSCEAITYGLCEGADYQAVHLGLSGGGAVFDVLFEARLLARVELQVPGEHNVLNALGSLAMAHQLGVEPASIEQGLKQFQGVQRRFETLCEDDGIVVIDDYAHHPVEIEATLAAGARLAKERQGKLCVVFQPHRYSRVESLLEDFGKAFEQADFLWLLPVYAAGEVPRPGSSHWDLYLKLSLERIWCEVLSARPPLQYFKERMREGDILITMGAGDITMLGRES